MRRGSLMRGGVGQGAGLDLRQRETDMLDGQDDVGGKRPFEAAADGHAVDRGDDRLVEIGQLLRCRRSRRPVVLVRRLAGGRRLQVPAGAEELLAAAGDDGDAQLRIVAEVGRRPRPCSRLVAASMALALGRSSTTSRTGPLRVTWRVLRSVWLLIGNGKG